MPRFPRYLLPDGVFHATARGAGQIAIFRDDDDRRTFLGLLAWVCHDFRWTCQAFCLMTNHYHLVIEALREDMSNGFRRLNGLYAQGFNARHGRWGHLFGERFWCRPLEEEDELERTCIYVLENPVRAGLCAQPRDWPWSACRFELD
jgi:putative transposase